MKRSSYHNVLQSWIKNGMLESYAIEQRKIATKYDEKRKVYVGKKTFQSVLVLNFRHNKSFFVRTESIDEYLAFIEKNRAGIIA